MFVSDEVCIKAFSSYLLLITCCPALFLFCIELWGLWERFSEVPVDNNDGHCWLNLALYRIPNYFNSYSVISNYGKTLYLMCSQGRVFKAHLARTRKTKKNNRHFSVSFLFSFSWIQECSYVYWVGKQMNMSVRPNKTHQFWAWSNKIQEIKIQKLIWLTGIKFSNWFDIKIQESTRNNLN